MIATAHSGDAKSIPVVGFARIPESPPEISSPRESNNVTRDRSFQSSQDQSNQDPGPESAQDDLSSTSSADHSKLPQPAVGRLSLYFRELHRLLESGETHINSRELGQLVDVSPAVVRRDLSALGTMGRRGVGYEITTLIQSIGTVLGSGIEWRVVLVGVGSLGDALLRYRGFERLGFRLCAALDTDPEKIGKEIGGVVVTDSATMAGRLAALQPELAILAVPAENASAVATDLVAAGVSGILNFAPTTLKLKGSTAVVNVDLASELQRLAFAVQNVR